MVVLLPPSPPFLLLDHYYSDNITEPFPPPNSSYEIGYIDVGMAATRIMDQTYNRQMSLQNLVRRVLDVEMVKNKRVRCRCVLLLLLLL